MTDDRLLLQKAQEGDRTAFEALVTLHSPRVFNLALGYTGRHHDAEEITQTVFWKVWNALPQFRGGASFSTWLYRLTLNACTDHYRREKKRRGDLSLDDPDLAPLRDTAPSPEEILLQREEQAILRKALAELPEQHRVILVLREMDGLDYKEIAQVLDLEMGTVKSRLARARRALRDKLLAEGNLFDGPSSNSVKGGMAP
ncbi:MAG: sigma-70 family RNA polymerase sigma factor [Ruminiclostridium sp.]|nr:sigma-70 family RNA polymerase sigma factor [Ruminiclostridium sp.]MBQ9853095.1 sigma-70 family RNA polymerase sigma factor [Ruminiclostridium sp.]MBQ9932418.1 sigma-70 family RNA polymerase sigma factor [Ruminiclostridium sp.]